MAEKKTGGKAASAPKKKTPPKKTASGATSSSAKKPGPQKTGTKPKTTASKAAPSSPKKTAPKKTPSKPAAAKQPAAKKNPPAPAAPQRMTIADRKVAWKSVDKWSLARWLMMIPLGFVGLVFTFVLAGYSFSALVCFTFMGILLFYNIAAILQKTYPHPTKVVKRIVTVILCIGLLIVGVTEALVIKASFGDPDPGCEYIVVLGAKVRGDGPSVSLQNRIDAAYAYLTAHPDTIAVVSGGKGQDEPITEAQCMFDHLVAMGIDPERIWVEDKATSTWENLQYSLDLIEGKTGLRPDTIGIISSEYHLFRAGLFADACNVESVGIPARTTRLSQMINHFMREVAGVWHYILLGGQYSD